MGFLPAADRQNHAEQQIDFYPKEAIEYVVVHEFAHFAHPDHSRAFWALVAEIMPDYKERKKLLNS